MNKYRFYRFRLTCAFSKEISVSEISTTVLVVDDDPYMLELLGLHIQSAGYGVLTAENGQQALSIIQDNRQSLDAIVSDVEMPELDGYELCANVRQMDKFKEMPFVFVSAKVSMEEKLKGYEVGGDDYITKPIDGEDVVIKVRHIIEKQIKHHSLTQQLQDSHNAAMQAMSYTSNLGLVLQFMKAAASVDDFENLAIKIFDVTSALGLSAVIQFHSSDKIVSFQKQGDVTPLEANVIEMARNKGRFFDFQTRTIINYDDFSLLILNMPVTDTEKYGLLKDILGNLCDAIEVKVKLLLTNVVVEQKDKVINVVTQALERIDQSYRDIQQANLAAIDDMVQKMEEAMFGFGLSESQEDIVRGIILYTKNKSAEIFEDGKELYNDFEEIHDTLVKGLK